MTSSAFSSASRLALSKLVSFVSEHTSIGPVSISLVTGLGSIIVMLIPLSICVAHNTSHNLLFHGAKSTGGENWLYTGGIENQLTGLGFFP